MRLMILYTESPFRISEKPLSSTYKIYLLIFKYILYVIRFIYRYISILRAIPNNI